MPEAEAKFHQALSEELRRAVHPADGVGEPLTLNGILERTHGRGAFLLLIVLCLPFLAPVSIPGVSVPFGFAIAFLGGRLALDLPARLPGWLGGRALPRGFERAMDASVKVLAFLERWIVRPRKVGWLGWRWIRAFNSMVVVVMALLLSLPIPPVIPLTNTIPAYAVLFMTLSMMEEDGLMIWGGYGVSLFALVYFYLWGDVIVGFVQKWLGTAFG